VPAATASLPRLRRRRRRRRSPVLIPPLTTPTPASPAQISERYRVPLSPTCPRAFDRMIEITDLISKGGGRQNRGEMGEVRDWLDSRGLGDDFALVIGNGSF